MNTEYVSRAAAQQAIQDIAASSTTLAEARTRLTQLAKDMETPWSDSSAQKELALRITHLLAFTPTKDYTFRELSEALDVPLNKLRSAVKSMDNVELTEHPTKRGYYGKRPYIIRLRNEREVRARARLTKLHKQGKRVSLKAVMDALKCDKQQAADLLTEIGFTVTKGVGRP